MVVESFNLGQMLLYHLKFMILL